MTKKKNPWPYLLLIPAIIIIICVVFFPIINAIGMSFQNYDLRRPKEIRFIGLENYITLFKDEIFWKSLKNTLLWILFGVGGQFIFGFILALVINKKFKGRGVARAIAMIPWVTPGVLIGLMWRWMYDGNYGVLNDIFSRLGIISDNIQFLSNKLTSLPSVTVAIIWQGIPFFALMILAALQGVPSELYEAAEVDGCSKVKQLFYITIPSIKNTILVTTLLRIIWVANSVDVIFNMTEGGPAYSSQTLAVYIYNKANALNLGYSSAMSIILCLLLLVVAIPYLRQNLRKEV